MPYTFVIFGASGDLTTRKLIPALYNIYQRGQLPEGSRIVGVARTAFDSAQWRQQLAQTTAEFDESFDPTIWPAFEQMIHYLPGDITQAGDFQRLAELLQQIEPSPANSRVYYLSTLPKLYATAAEQLGANGLADQSQGRRRLVIEKPFGVDLPTARQLNADIHRVFSEDQVFRIDHYLGKETVQNILVLRFANSIFEPVWNRNYVDHVQITVAEDGVVGRRGAYYESAGVMRDMFQNHLLQLMMVVAMEAPARYQANLVRDEKVKILQSIRPWDKAHPRENSVRGQYIGYRNEEGVNPQSTTATFAAIRLWIDNWRWQGVPFYLRSGKGMSCRTTQIVVQFRRPPQMLFAEEGNRLPDANRLVIQIQPAEGIQLHFQTKVPDAGMKLRMTDLDFRFRREFSAEIPDAYERLLLDAANGDASLFARNDEVELAWQVIDPILASWLKPDAPPLEPYYTAQWGPIGAGEWIQSHGRDWFDVCPVLH